MESSNIVLSLLVVTQFSHEVTLSTKDWSYEDIDCVSTALKKLTAALRASTSKRPTSTDPVIACLKRRVQINKGDKPRTKIAIVSSLKILYRDSYQFYSCMMHKFSVQQIYKLCVGSVRQKKAKNNLQATRRSN